MKYAFAQIAFGLGASALVARDSSQCIQLQASGGVSGILGQLSDGQNRVGGNLPAGCYCLGNGGFTDTQGRGCILTPPTTQFQCDVGATATSGFAIGSNGQISHSGSTTFYACPASDSEYNVYTTPVAGQSKCVQISLSSAGPCGSSAQSSAPAASSPAAKSSAAPKPSAPAMSSPAPKPSAPVMSSPAPAPPAPKPSAPAMSSPAPAPPAPAPVSSCASASTVTVTVTAPAPSAPAPKPSAPAMSSPAPAPPAPKPSAPAMSSPAPAPPAPKPSAPAMSPPAPKPSAPAQSGMCPADLNGAYQYPHLIVPVDSQQPSKAYGTSYNGIIDSHTCSIFNFDIPASYSGKTCTLTFLFPEQKDLETSSYTVSGSGAVTFSQLSSPANQQTTYANQPSKKSDLASMTIAPGNSYSIASGSCAAGQTVTYEICGTGSFALNYFQDYNPSPIGLYVREC